MPVDDSKHGDKPKENAREGGNLFKKDRPPPKPLDVLHGPGNISKEERSQVEKSTKSKERSQAKSPN